MTVASTRAVRDRWRNRLWRVVTFGKATTVWIDQDEHVRLLEQARLAEDLQADVHRFRRSTRQLKAQSLARSVATAAGIGEAQLRLLQAAFCVDPPTTEHGRLDEAALRNLIEDAVASTAVERFLAYRI